MSSRLFFQLNFTTDRVLINVKSMNIFITNFNKFCWTIIFKDMVKIAIALLGLVGLGAARWEPEHEFSPDVSGNLAKAIKQKL